MILCLDLETTGLDEQRSGLLEIGACWLHSGDSFFRACRPLATCKIEPEALAVNGWTVERLIDPKLLPEAQAIAEFIGWVRGAHGANGKVQIAAWNAHFDHRHLCAGMARAGYESCHRPFAHRLIDVHSVLAVDRMRAKLPPVGVLEMGDFGSFGDEVKNADAGSALLKLGEEPKPHNALAGARQVRAMLRRLLGDAGALP